MDTIYTIGPNGELYHWGTKGMKWGIRRYQNKDGSLTPAGRKRYAEEEAKLKAREKTIKNRENIKAKNAKLAAKKAELDAREEALKGGKKKDKKARQEEKAANKPKTMRDMTDDELREHTTRMQLEKQYIDAQKNLAAAIPKEVSKSKAFVDSVKNDVLVPALKSAGKAWAEDYMKNKLGLKSDADVLKDLENDYKKLEWKIKKQDLEKAGTLKEVKEPKEMTWDEKLKQQTYEKNARKEREEAEEAAKKAEEAAKAARKEAVKRQKNYNEIKYAVDNTNVDNGRRAVDRYIKNLSDEFIFDERWDD